jgi:lysozyme family protein
MSKADQTKWDTAFRKLMDWECHPGPLALHGDGFVAAWADDGGPTVYGISTLGLIETNTSQDDLGVSYDAKQAMAIHMRRRCRNAHGMLEEAYLEHSDRDKYDSLCLELKKVSVDVAEIWYKEHFWSQVYEEIPLRPAIKILLFSVNANPKSSWKLAQHSANLCHLFASRIHGIPAQPLTVDGLPGTQTIEAINSINPDVYFEMLEIVQSSYYLSRTIARPEQIRFWAGWCGRALDAFSAIT